MTDPRFDQLARAHWDGLTELLRAAVLELNADEPAKAALMEVIDLHVAWEKREQIFDPDYSHDVVHGIGCRTCDYLPSPKYVDIEHWHCMTAEALRRALLPAESDAVLPPSDLRAQSRAWVQGYQAGYGMSELAQGIGAGAALARRPKNPYDEPAGGVS